MHYLSNKENIAQAEVFGSKSKHNHLIKNWFYLEETREKRPAYYYASGAYYTGEWIGNSRDG